MSKSGKWRIAKSHFPDLLIYTPRVIFQIYSLIRLHSLSRFTYLYSYTINSIVHIEILLHNYSFIRKDTFFQIYHLYAKNDFPDIHSYTPREIIPSLLIYTPTDIIPDFLNYTPRDIFADLLIWQESFSRTTHLYVERHFSG